VSIVALNHPEVVYFSLKSLVKKKEYNPTNQQNLNQFYKQLKKEPCGVALKRIGKFYKQLFKQIVQHLS
jgi:hypothetical protein